MKLSIGRLNIGLALFLATFANQGQAQSTATSNVWSGYAVTGSEFTLATGSWHVPEVNCSKTPGDYSIFWVGIDGYANNTVEQIGTSSNCTTPGYFAWYQFPPSARVVITSVPVSPGDVIGAYVYYSLNSVGSPIWTIWLKDYTTGQSYSGEFPYTGQQRSSAEWIAERPCCITGNSPEFLADFDKANFGGYLTGVPDTNFATDSTTSGNIAVFGNNAIAITMVDKATGTVLATPGALEGEGGSAGASFTVSWKASGQ